MHVTTSNCTLYFQGSGLPNHAAKPGLDSMYNVDMAFQELQAVVLMPCRMAFHLSGKSVALHLDYCLVYVL